MGLSFQICTYYTTTLHKLDDYLRSAKIIDRDEKAFNKTINDVRVRSAGKTALKLTKLAHLI